MNLDGLISTIITATAAIVAIIGGFLVSRVITLASEKNSIVRRLKEINNDLSAKKGILQQVETEILEDDIDDFVYEYCKEIIIEDKNIDDILEEDDSTNLTLQQITPFLEELHLIKNTVLNWIKNSNSLPKDFDDFLKNNNYKVETRKDWHKLVYETIWDELPEDPTYDPLGINSSLLATMNMPNLINPVNHDYRDKIKELDSLSKDIEILKLRKKEQEKILNDYGKPVGLWGGFWVLVYACTVGIVYPSILLPYPEGTYNDQTTKWFLLLLFFSELIALFAYLGISMLNLTKDE